MPQHSTMQSELCITWSLFVRIYEMRWINLKRGAYQPYKKPVKIHGVDEVKQMSLAAIQKKAKAKPTIVY